MGRGRGGATRSAKVRPTDAEAEALDLSGPVWCEGSLELKGKALTQFGRWQRHYFVLRRRTLSYYSSYMSYQSGRPPARVARALFVRLPEGVVGEVRVIVGTTRGTWLLQPDSRSEQCRWVNALWWALEPTRDELRMLQRHKALERKRLINSRRTSQTLREKPDSILIHKNRAKRRVSQQGSTVAGMMSSRPASAGVESKEDAIEAVAAAGKGKGKGAGAREADAGAEDGTDAAPAAAAPKSVTFAQPDRLTTVCLLPVEDYVDRKQRRSLFYTVGDIVAFQRDAERPFDSCRVFVAGLCDDLRRLCSAPCSAPGRDSAGTGYAGGDEAGGGGITLRGSYRDSEQARVTAGAAGGVGGHGPGSQGRGHGHLSYAARSAHLSESDARSGSMRNLIERGGSVEGAPGALAAEAAPSPSNGAGRKRVSL